MASYCNLALEVWQKYASEVCTAVDQKIKEEAEQFFYMFVQTPNMDVIVNLIERGSDLLVFSLFSYISKNSQAFVRDCDCFLLLMRVVSGWQLREFNFVRLERQPFQSFVTRTIMMTLGTLMKLLYQNAETSNKLINILTELPLNFFKILTLKTFIEVVETVDSEMGYMRFRTMVYAFQDNVIPMVCECLMPFFCVFQQGLRINDLSSDLQSRLDMSEQHKHLSAQQRLSLSREQQMQSQYVLMLLKKIVQFNYNITYTEYESEQVIDTCLITFPDKVLEKIINHEFLSSLFYVIEKVMESKVGERKNEYLDIVLECLAKIMQARLGYVSDDHKEKFICAAVNGLTHLLQVCQQLQSETLLEGILVCNKKLLMSVELSYIQKVIEHDEVLNKAELYQIYLRDLSCILLHIFRKSYIHTENNLLNEALEVSSKMISHLGYKDSETMEDPEDFFIKFLKDIIVSYIQNLCQSRYIFPTVRVVWISENKQAVNGLFQIFKKLASYVYFDLFSALDFALERYMREQREEISIFANILFLLSELVDRHFLERNVNLNKAKDKDIALLASTVKKASVMVQEYAANRKAYCTVRDAYYLDIAVLLFSESLLMQFLSSFESSSTIKIKQKLYLLMVYGQKYSEQVQLEEKENESEQTIAVYLNIIFQFLNSEVVSSDADVKMLYALQVVEKVIFKLKWNMRRQSFLKCHIFKQMLVFFDEYFNNCFQTPDIMAKVGKITVSLNFDDILDEYKFRINKFIAKLPKQESVGPIFYYLTGIFQGIEPGNICRYFCYRLKRELNLPSFLSSIFKMAVDSNSDKDYKDVCRLCKLICLNKGLKNSNNSSLAYQLFGLILPHLIWFMNTINNSKQLNVDLLGDAISELIELFCGVVNGTHVNVFVLDEGSISKQSHQNGPLGRQYVGQFFRLLLLLTRQLKMYPKLQQSCLHCFVSINKQILQYIYDNDDGKLSQIYNILMLTELDMVVQYITSQLNGNRLIEDRLLKAVDSARLFYQYINRKSQILHKRKVIDHLKKYLQLSESFSVEGGAPENKNQKLIFYCVSLILTNHKNNQSYIRGISKLLYELNKRYRHYILGAFHKLKISSHKFSQVQNILQTFGGDIEQNFVQHFKIWVKECNQFK